MTSHLAGNHSRPEEPTIWLDFWDYAQRLFLGGEAMPWLDPAAFDGVYRQALGLLDPAVAPIDLDRLTACYLAANPGIRAAMTRRARPSFPLKTLLGDAGLRAAVARLADATRDARKSKPLALTVSSPLRLMNDAHRFAHGAPMPEAGPGAGEDDCERGAVYLTDFLGALAQPQGTFVLLVDEDGEAAAPNFSHVLNPLSNLCRHMRWTLALATRAPVVERMSAQLVFTPAGLDGVWGPFEEAAATGNPLYAAIPADARPEAVLSRLKALRGRA